MNHVPLVKPRLYTLGVWMVDFHVPKNGHVSCFKMIDCGNVFLGHFSRVRIASGSHTNLV